MTSPIVVLPPDLRIPICVNGKLKVVISGVTCLTTIGSSLFFASPSSENRGISTCAKRSVAGSKKEGWSKFASSGMKNDRFCCRVNCYIPQAPPGISKVTG